MSLKLPIRIQKKTVDSIINYVRDQGYLVTEKSQGTGHKVYMTNAPGWGDLTPLIETYKGDGPIQCWFYIRLGSEKDKTFLASLEEMKKR